MIERMENGLALGETFLGFAGIAKHDTPGSKAIEYMFGELGTVGGGELGIAGVLIVQMRGAGLD